MASSMSRTRPLVDRVADAAYKTTTLTLAAATAVSGTWLLATMGSGFYHYATVGRQPQGTAGGASPMRKDGVEITIKNNAELKDAPAPSPTPTPKKSWWKVW